MTPQALPAADHEFRGAIRSRYFRAFLAPAPLAVLACGILANIILHYWAFDVISERFHWYRDMTMVILGLSVDFYLLCLVGLTHHTFQTYANSGIYRDLRTAGVRAWDVFRPLLEVLMVLIIADTAIEALLDIVLGHQPAGLAVLGYMLMLVYAFIAALFTGCILVAMNLLRLQLVLQYFAILTLSFLSLSAVSKMADALQPSLHAWNPDKRAGGLMHAIARLAGAQWNNFSDQYAYYAALIAEGVLFTVLSVPLYALVRRISEARFPKF